MKRSHVLTDLKSRFFISMWDAQIKSALGNCHCGDKNEFWHCPHAARSFSALASAAGPYRRVRDGRWESFFRVDAPPYLSGGAKIFGSSFDLLFPTRGSFKRDSAGADDFDSQVGSKETRGPKPWPPFSQTSWCERLINCTRYKLFTADKWAKFKEFLFTAKILFSYCGLVSYVQIFKNNRI